MMDWDQYFMSMAYLVSMKSKDTSTRIGAVIVGPDHEIRSTGYNGLPRGVKENIPERNERPAKYFWYEHGERNAIYNAARMGTSVKGCTMYTQGIPCADCARAVIQSGIQKVIIDSRIEELKENSNSNSNSNSNWTQSCAASREMLSEAGIIVHSYDGPLITSIIGLQSGQSPWIATIV
jgi:dCMP deaminase